MPKVQIFILLRYPYSQFTNFTPLLNVKKSYKGEIIVQVFCNFAAHSNAYDHFPINQTIHRTGTKDA